MTPIQIVIAVIGGLIVLSYFIDFKALLSKFKQGEVVDMATEKDIVVKVEDSRQPGIDVGSTKPTLSNIVAQWEALKAHCEDRGLVEASAKLEEVFPLLIKKG